MSPDHLTLPVERSVRYEENFIRTAVCELRFPTLLELEQQPPTKFQKILRKQYPYYKKMNQIALSDAGASPISPKYSFESRKKDWTVLLRPSSISLETSHYTEFKDFRDRLENLLKDTRALLDTDFFTRLGFRYINSIPIQDKDLEDWVNSALIQPILTGVLGTLSKYRSELHGLLQNGKYSVRHGFDRAEDTEGSSSQYILDFDYYMENVDFNQVMPLVCDFHDTNFSFFRWALGKKAKELLGPGLSRHGE